MRRSWFTELSAQVLQLAGTSRRLPPPPRSTRLALITSSRGMITQPVQIRSSSRATPPPVLTHAHFSRVGSPRQSLMHSGKKNPVTAGVFQATPTQDSCRTFGSSRLFLWASARSTPSTRPSSIAFCRGAASRTHQSSTSGRSSETVSWTRLRVVARFSLQPTTSWTT